GAGVLAPLPAALFGGHGVGMVFLPPDRGDEARAVVGSGLADEGLRIVGWREVPVDPSALGDLARATMPCVAQVLVRRPGAKDAERWAFRARKRIEREARRRGLGLYVASLSFSTVTYKAL